MAHEPTTPPRRLSFSELGADHTTHAPITLRTLLTATAINERLLMRIIHTLENSSWERMTDEVEVLRKRLEEEADTKPADPVEPGDLPVGREEERRGTDLPSPPDEEPTAEPPLGTDNETRAR